MAKKPTTSTPVTEGNVVVEVLDSLQRDGEDFGEGDVTTMPLAEAIALRALGVVHFDDSAVTTDAPKGTDGQTSTNQA